MLNALAPLRGADILLTIVPGAALLACGSALAPLATFSVPREGHTRIATRLAYVELT